MAVGAAPAARAPSGGWVLAVLAGTLLAGFAAPASADFLVTFYLVPESEWNGGSPVPEALLHDGEVLLYREGRYEPELRVALGEAVAVPAGRWSWIGQAPGHVTVAAGSLYVSDAKAAPGEHVEKRILWPAAPSCELVLEGDWRGVERIDVASLGRGAVYPTSRPRAGVTRHVPAGEWIAYGVRSGRLTGMSGVGRCRQNEKIGLPPPPAPPADRQNLMVHAVVPTEPAVRGGPELLVSLEGEMRPATARLTTGRRSTFFFRHLPASDASLLLRHSELRSVEAEVEPVGGSSRELAPFELEHRADVELSIDYRPRRPHRLARLEVLFCGRSEQVRFVPGRCTQVAQRPLHQGMETYRIDDLDDGRYLFNARIDDEWVAGLGQGLFLFISPERPEALRPQPAKLEEMEVWGHLLVDDREVPGEVVLAPREERLPKRRATTGEDLVYHLFYFGGLPDSYARRLLPEPVAGLGDDELFGLYGDYQIQACDLEARCRVLPLRSFLVGSGRLDLDLGSDRGVLVEVVDAESGEPVPRAPVVSAAGDRRRLVFVHGEALWLPRHGGEVLPRRTGDDGVARLRDLPAGEVSVLVKPRGYRQSEAKAVVPESGWARVRVEVGRTRGGRQVELTFPDGQPVGGAFLVVYDSNGARRPQCDVSTSEAGEADLDDGCLEDARLVLLHPEAAVAVLDGRALEASGLVEVSRAPSLPLRLRVRDENGAAVSSAVVELGFDDLVLGPSELLAPLRAYQSPLFYVSDAAGEVVLRGIDPTVQAPVVRLRRSDLRAEVSTTGHQPGETIVVVLGP